MVGIGTHDSLLAENEVYQEIYYSPVSYTHLMTAVLNGFQLQQHIIVWMEMGNPETGHCWQQIILLADLTRLDGLSEPGITGMAMRMALLQEGRLLTV